MAVENRISVSFADHEFLILERLSTHTHMTKAALIRTIVEQFLRENPDHFRRKTRVKRTKNLLLSPRGADVISSNRPVNVSMIHSGIYYEKNNRSGWLRLFLGLDRVGNGVYADFSGIGTCSIEHLARWSKASYSAAEARRKFPDQCAEIDKVAAAAQRDDLKEI